MSRGSQILFLWGKTDHISHNSKVWRAPLPESEALLGLLPSNCPFTPSVSFLSHALPWDTARAHFLHLCSSFWYLLYRSQELPQLRQPPKAGVGKALSVETAKKKPSWDAPSGQAQRQTTHSEDHNKDKPMHLEKRSPPTCNWRTQWMWKGQERGEHGRRKQMILLAWKKAKPY